MLYIERKVTINPLNFVNLIKYIYIYIYLPNCLYPLKYKFFNNLFLNLNLYKLNKLLLALLNDIHTNDNLRVTSLPTSLKLVARKMSPPFLKCLQPSLSRLDCYAVFFWSHVASRCWWVCTHVG